ncbi:MAG TPA: hypothetical protein VHM30_17890, partial [Gemmatimonadaceae bacterium]|nr:hypothetical protein [Gemmatimonadaceae bacterium]
MRGITQLARNLALVALLVVSNAAAAPAQGYKVIVNASNPTTKLSRSEVAAFFLKKNDRWSTGAAAVPVDLAEGTATRDAFSKGVLGKSTATVKAYWNQMVFSGRNVPPPEKKSDAEVLAYVRNTPGAI